MKKIEEQNLSDEEIQALIERLRETDKKIYILFNQGLNQTEIAEQMGFSRQEVSRRIIIMKTKGIKFEKGLLHYTKNGEKVLELIKQGLSRDQIAKELNMKITDVIRCIELLRKFGFEFTVKRKKYPKSESLDDIDKEILRLRKQGATLEQICKQINRAKLTVINRMNKMQALGVDVSKLNIPILNRNKEIMELYINGISLKEIAEKVGVALAVVRKTISKNKNQIFETNIYKEVMQLHESGIKVEEIAEKMQIPLERLYKIFDRIGLNARSERNKKIVELFLNGVNIKTIAQEMGLSDASIRDVLAISGTKPRRSRLAKKHDTTKANNGVDKEKMAKAIHNLIESRHATDEQLSVIAEYYGVDLDVVKKVGKYIDRDER